MVEIGIVYRGQLRCEASHRLSGSRVVTDAPLDNMGKGESFSPTDLVATALGACMLTIMGIVAQRNGLELEGTRVTVRKEMVSLPRRRIGTLSVIFDVPVFLNEEQKRLLERAAQTCPVKLSLHPDVQTILQFNWKESS